MSDSPHAENLAYVEAIYQRYLRDPESVSPRWRDHFASGNGHDPDAAPSSPPAPRPITGGVGQRRTPGVALGRPAEPSSGGGAAIDHLQHRVDLLVRNYRVRGHMMAELDPLGRTRPKPPELDLASMGLDGVDMNRQFSVDGIDGEGESRMSLGQIVENLQQTYCRSIGVQFMHIDDLGERRWLQSRMEKTGNHIELSTRQQVRILHRLTDAVVVEQFMQRKYVGAKTFSLEGAESLIPLLEIALEKAADQGVEDIVMGMAHRGRINVLSNLLGKEDEEIFREFEDMDPHLYRGGGDVKYHLGHSSDWHASEGRRIHLSLCFNPSHLEFINPVVLGRVRGRQDRAGDQDRRRSMPLLIHGDAAFAGEGIVQESLNLSELPAYAVGGTLHVIINNQLGFTTDPEDSRSSTYCTEVAKMLQVPIFHVNGEDPEAVAQAVDVAMDFRDTFRRDAIIDMYCYRLQG
ncbi:MAG: thiamine pyrophosphate-dependent enzyme, partial [Phycisphaeraceae bacterium]|nr:thiamine pyrophosphate-dependent enzyme [Phycisphaeraceae bacterium]